MKITIITHNLSSGGVQKSVIALANALKNQYTVSFLLFEPKEFFYEPPQESKINYLEFFNIDVSSRGVGLELFEKRVLAMKEFLSSDDSDLYVVFEDYNSIVTLTANRFNKKIIVSSRISLEFYKERMIHLLPYDFYISAIKTLYPKAVNVVAVSDGIKKELSSIGVLARTIYNGIDIAKVTELAKEECVYESFLLHIGRMDFAQKGQLDALNIFHKISDKTDRNLIFVGDGKDLQKLKIETARLGLQNRVIFVGVDKNPYRFLKKCDLLLFSSYFEGTPNVLLEAMSLGTAIVSYDFLPEAREFCKNEGAFLISLRGDIDAMCKSTLHLLEDVDDRSKTKALALETATYFDKELNVSKWMGCIGESLK